MPLSVTYRAITEASRAAAQRGLKAAGFRRQGNHLHRVQGTIIHAIHFQASQWGTADAGRFTVNLGVTSEWLYSSWTSRPLPANPATALFPVNQRIGNLMPSRLDHWWSVDRKTDIAVLSQEVAAAILEYGPPFFETLRDSEAMLNRFREGAGLPGLPAAQAPLVHAMLAMENGLVQEAQDQIDRAFAAAGVSPFRHTVQRLGKRLGVPPTHA